MVGHGDQHLTASLIMLSFYRRSQWHRLARKPAYALEKAGRLVKSGIAGKEI